VFEEQNLAAVAAEQGVPLSNLIMSIKPRRDPDEETEDKIAVKSEIEYKCAKFPTKILRNT